jgi:hypothetical protein
MADIALRIKADFKQAEKAFNALSADSERLEKDIQKLQKRFSGDQIDKFTRKNKLNAAALTATRGAAAGLKAETMGLRREMERAIRAGIAPNSEYVKRLQKDYIRLNQQLDNTKNRTKNTALNLKNMALAGGGFVIFSKAADFMKKSVKAASDLEEVTSKFNTVFKTSVFDIDKSVNQLTASYAMSTREARQYLSSVQDLLVPMGLAPDVAAKMSDEVVKLSADLGSFNNMPTSRVMADIQSALVGNFETMKKYGVVLNETVIKQEAMNKGLWNGKGMIDAATKAQVAYSLIVKGSQAAIGDMARTSNSYANQLKKLNSRVEDFSAAMGEPVKKALTDAMIGMDLTSESAKAMGQNFGQVIGVLIKVVSWAGKAIGAFSGLNNMLMMTAHVQKQINDAAKRNPFVGLANAQRNMWKKVEAITRKNLIAMNNNIFAQKQYKAALKDTKKTAEELSKEEEKRVNTQRKNTASLISSVVNISNAFGALFQNIASRRIALLDAQMNKELERAGVAEKTTVQQAQIELEAARKTGNELDIVEKERALKKAEIEEKYFKKRQKMEYDMAMTQWKFQMAAAAAQIPIVILSALSSGWKLGPLGAGTFAALAGAAAATQLAAVSSAKPVAPTAQTGLTNYTVPDIGATRNDRAAFYASGGETVNVTPRGENNNRDMNMVIQIEETPLIRIVQKWIDTGELRFSNKNIGSGVFAT